MFYHIAKRDIDLEIMCETGYNHYQLCGLSGLNSSVSIPTSDTIKEGKEIYVKQIYYIYSQVLPLLRVCFQPL